MNHLKAMKEWEAWRKVCHLLEEAGAVTREDLESTKAIQQTAGQRLLEAIRLWGRALADLQERP